MKFGLFLLRLTIPPYTPALHVRLTRPFKAKNFTMKPELIYDWNKTTQPTIEHHLILHDETLRDGLQSPSIKLPDIHGKIEILHHLVGLGIHSIDLGMPASSAKEFADVHALLTEIRDQRLPIRAVAAARTLIGDLSKLAELQQLVGVPIEAAAFLGSSPIRMTVEDWSLDFLVEKVRQTGIFCRQQEISLNLITEDTTRAKPETITAIYSTALDEGAAAICAADTCGHATPRGARTLITFIRDTIIKNHPVRLDWHGHNDRGLGLANAIAAFDAGADCLHGTLLGIGERCGNVALDQILVNLALKGYWDQSMHTLAKAMARSSEILHMEIPFLYPVFGRDAFRTGTGVHAAAIVKALQRDDKSWADIIYSGVPATMVGRHQEIEVGPIAGHSNVHFWLNAHGYEDKPEYVELILQHAKKGDHILSDAEIKQMLHTCDPAIKS